MATETVRTDWTRQLFVRELRTLGAELDLYPDEPLVWQVAPGVSNSAGTLTLHVCGNLQHFVGAVLGDTGYVRQRDLEFGTRDLPRAALMDEVERTVQVVDRVLAARDDALLLEAYPDILGGLRIPCGLWLQHLNVHLGYHVGQVGYLRRLLTGNGTSANAVDMKLLR